MEFKLKSGRKIGLNQAFNCDCLDFMQNLPDKCIDLVLTDPPYGIGTTGQRKNSDRPTEKWKNPNSKVYKEKDWDNEAPSEKVFKEIFRISKNQIIFGGNYFTEHLPPSSGWIVWDKRVNPKEHLSMCELAYTSFNKRLMKYEYLYAGFKKEIQEQRFHPTQKPLKLFKWCLEKYAPENAIVFDPFLGSFTTAVACHHYGLQWLGCEKDEDYFKAGYDRYNNECKQIFMEF